MNSEQNKCAFCRKETGVARQYLHAKNKPTTGDGFDYIYYCGECGLRETVSDNNNTPTPKEWEEELMNVRQQTHYPHLKTTRVFVVEDLKQFISKTISQEKEKMIEEINKVESENWQDSYEAGFEDAKEAIINLLQNK